ncbi:MAG: transposase [Pseudomonadales bacterium]|nr:transposase [Pseudomonadales bacterium]
MGTSKIDRVRDQPKRTRSILVLNSTPTHRRQYSAEFKAKVVAACRQPGTSVSSVAIANSINANIVHRWVREHEHGKSWPFSGQPRTYVRRPIELKRMIVARCLEPGAMHAQVAAVYGVTPKQVRVWMKKFQTEQVLPGDEPPKPHFMPAPENWLPVVVSDAAAPEPTVLEPAPLPALLPEVVLVPKPSPVPSLPPSTLSEPAPGEIDIELNGARLQLRGAVDLKALRVVMEALTR